jgi:hypothetical protein
MMYLKRAKRGCIEPRCFMAFLCITGFFLFFLSSPVHSGTIALPQTGQTLCYNSAGAFIPCLGTGEDGDILAGVTWPEPRFTGYLFSCIVDNLTGLMWYANPIDFSLPRVWSEAVIIPPQISQCGFADWRLPNVNELQSLINAEQPDNVSWLESQGFIFPSSAALPYWTSTSSAASQGLSAWTINIIDGSVLTADKLSTLFVWPVRGITNPPAPAVSPPAQIPKTGQTFSYSPPSFDDGYFQAGVPWPTLRFTRTFCDSTGPCAEQLVDCDLSSPDVVTDNLTGIVWTENANLDGLKAWANALTFTEDLTICGYVDWRLPNSKELFSLIDRSQSNPALPALHPFTNVQSGVDDLYWSSTTYAFDPTGAWTIDMLLGGLIPRLKTDPDQAFVWPVRGGQTRPYILEIEKLGTGQGKVAAPGLTCVGKFCTGEFSSYEVVTVTATANPGSVFTGWGGDACSGFTESTCAIIMTADTTATATFLPEYKISVDPKSLNFKNLKKDVPSDSLTVTVTNVGVADLVLSPPVIAGDFPSVFSQTNDCPAALASNAFCTITVTATSPDYDKKTAELQIVSNDPKKPTTIVKLKAKAKPPKIAKKPGSLNFGKVAQPGSLDKTLTITNKGVTDLIIGSITITGDNPGDFSIVLPDICSGSTLATDASCILTLRFTPSVADKRSAVLNIPSNDPKKQPALTVKLKGTGE